MGLCSSRLKAPHGPPPNGTPDGLPLHYRPALRSKARGPPILWPVQNGGTFGPFERKSPSPRLLFCYMSPNGRGVAYNLPSTIIFAIKICLSHLVCKLHLVLHFLRGTVSSRRKPASLFNNLLGIVTVLKSNLLSIFYLFQM